MSTDTRRDNKPGDLSTDLQTTPSIPKLVDPKQTRDGFFDFLQDSFFSMIGIPTDQNEADIHIAIVYRVDVENSFLGIFAENVKVRARIMEPDSAHAALPIPLGFSDQAFINFLPEFESTLEILGGNPPKVGDPIEVSFKNPNLKTKVFGNGVINKILDRQKVQGIYDNSPFLKGRENFLSPFTNSSLLEECKSARDKFSNLAPPDGVAIKRTNKNLPVSANNPRKMNSPVDDLAVDEAEALIRQNPTTPWNRIKVKRGGPLDRDEDGRIDDGIGERAAYRVGTAKDIAGGAAVGTIEAGLFISETVAQIKDTIKLKNIRRSLGGALKGGVRSGARLRRVGNTAVDELGIVGDTALGDDRTGQEILIGMAFDPVFGSIEAAKFAAEAAGFDADLGAFYFGQGINADPEARAKLELDRRRITTQVDCAKVYAIKNFVKRRSAGIGTPSDAERDVNYSNLGPPPRTWSRKNDRLIKKLHPEARHPVAEFINTATSMGIFLLLTETFRTPKRQDTLYAKGRTTPKLGKKYQVTKARGTPKSSIHQFGIAFDCVEVSSGINEITREKFEVRDATWVDGYDNRYPKARHQFIGSIGKQFGFIWGGDFKSFFDGYHFEVFSKSPSKLRRTLASGQKVQTNLPDPPYEFPDFGSSAAVPGSNMPMPPKPQRPT